MSDFPESGQEMLILMSASGHPLLVLLLISWLVRVGDDPVGGNASMRLRDAVRPADDDLVNRLHVTKTKVRIGAVIRQIRTTYANLL